LKINPKQVLPLAALSILLIVLAVLFFNLGKESTGLPEAAAPESEAGEETAVQVETRRIVLYFLAENDVYLHPEEREIPIETAPIDEARRVMEELIKGSRRDGISAIPPETRVREIYLMETGVATVDFSREFQDNHPSGAAAENATVFAVVNTLVRNIELIKRVFILVEGGEKETLKGHISLRRALLPRFDLVVGERP
jgi:spore germination protein GerM